jgi:hypothetical protein
MERGPGRHGKISKLVERRQLSYPTLRIPEATLTLLQWPAFLYLDRGPRSPEPVSCGASVGERTVGEHKNVS